MKKWFLVTKPLSPSCSTKSGFADELGLSIITKWGEQENERTIPKLPSPRIEDVTSVTQCNATIGELEPGLFLTPTSKRLMEELGQDGGKNFKQMLVKISIRLRRFTKMQVKQIDQTQGYHQEHTHGRQMGSAQPRGELKMCNHGKCSCCANARETLARLLKWARYACAPTYERTVPSSIPTMVCMR